MSRLSLPFARSYDTLRATRRFRFLGLIAVALLHTTLLRLTTRLSRTGLVLLSLCLTRQINLYSVAVKDSNLLVISVP